LAAVESGFSGFEEEPWAKMISQQRGDRHYTFVVSFENVTRDRVRFLSFLEDVEASSELAGGTIGAETAIVDNGLRRKIEAAFGNAAEEDIEDGMDSRFSQELSGLINEHGVAAVAVAEGLIAEGKINALVAAEALQWLGRIHHPQSLAYRLEVLKRALSSTFVQVRAGAAFGLAYLDNPEALPSLRQAIERERCAELRKDMMVVLEQLEESRECPSC
jgi:hypothetical protein